MYENNAQTVAGQTYFSPTLSLKHHIYSAVALLLHPATYQEKDYVGNTGCTDLAEIVSQCMEQQGIDGNIAKSISKNIHSYFNQHLATIEPFHYGTQLTNKGGMILDSKISAIINVMRGGKGRSTVEDLSPAEKKIWDAIPTDDKGRKWPHHYLWNLKPGMIEEISKRNGDFGKYVVEIGDKIIATNPGFYAHFEELIENASREQ